MTHLTAITQDFGTVTGFRYYIELASNDIDSEGFTSEFKMIDALVVEPTKEALQQLINAAGLAKDWTIVSFWQPEENCPF